MGHLKRRMTGIYSLSLLADRNQRRMSNSSKRSLLNLQSKYSQKKSKKKYLLKAV
jgi:hypothetical protein